jgi:hypothetical protein
MAGRIVANTIVPGYSEPGVTADEIVGLVNKYGLGLNGYEGMTSKTYRLASSGALVNTNDYTNVYEAAPVELEPWPIASNALIMVSAKTANALSPPRQNADDNTYAGIIATIGGIEYLSYGSIGQSSRDGFFDPVGHHGSYQMHRVEEIPAGLSVLVKGKFQISGIAITFEVNDLLASASIFVNVMRVIR